MIPSMPTPGRTASPSSGDSHIYGREGIHFDTRGKVVTSRWPDPQHRGVNLGFPQMK